MIGSKDVQNGNSSLKLWNIGESNIGEDGTNPTRGTVVISPSKQASEELSPKVLIEILTEISGISGQNGSNSVKNSLFKTEPRNRLEPAFLKGKLPKGVSETLVEVAGIEPAGAVGSTPASKRDSAHSPEALIKILTNLTDEDRQLLTRIVERWGTTSDELKRAVLRVVGDG